MGMEEHLSEPDNAFFLFNLKKEEFYMGVLRRFLGEPGTRDSVTQAPRSHRGAEAGIGVTKEPSLHAILMF